MAVAAALTLAVVVASPAGAVRAARPTPALLLAQTADDGDVEQAKAAMEKARGRVNEIQRDLKAVQEQRELAQAQRREASQTLHRATVSERRLQLAIGIRARVTYMKGSPTSIASLISTGDAGKLLDRFATLTQLARIDSLTVKDLQTVQDLAKQAQKDLAAAEEAAARAQQSLEVKLEAADEAYENRLAVFNELNAEAAREAADQLAAARNAEVTGGGGGRCDLSGLPAAAREIILRESGGRPTANNPNSTAFGLGQLLIGNRIRLMGDNYASTDCSTQFAAFEAYTLGRYGTYEEALAFHNDKGWY